MKFRATVTFAGQVSMRRGEARELTADIAAPLLKCGYLEEVKENEDKRNRPKRDSKSHKGSGSKPITG